MSHEMFRNRQAIGSIPQLPSRPGFPVSGLIAYWPFESDCNDIKGSYHGTPSSVTFGAGKVGNGAILDADTDYITIPAIAGSTITIAGYYYYTGIGGGGWNTLFCRNSGTYHHCLIQDTDRVIGFYNSAWYPSSMALSTGTWYHIIIEKVGATEKIYIDNNLVLNSASSFDNNSFPFSIIGNYASTGPSQGSIGIFDELGVWNRTLTDDEKAIISGGKIYRP